MAARLKLGSSGMSGIVCSVLEVVGNRAATWKGKERETHEKAD
jgi:hypothetical protein